MVSDYVLITDLCVKRECMPTLRSSAGHLGLMLNTPAHGEIPALSLDIVDPADDLEPIGAAGSGDPAGRSVAGAAAANVRSSAAFATTLTSVQTRVATNRTPQPRTATPSDPLRASKAATRSARSNGRSSSGTGRRKVPNALASIKSTTTSPLA